MVLCDCSGFAVLVCDWLVCPFIIGDFLSVPLLVGVWIVIEELSDGFPGNALLTGDWLGGGGVVLVMMSTAWLVDTMFGNWPRGSAVVTDFLDCIVLLGD